MASKEKIERLKEQHPGLFAGKFYARHHPRLAELFVTAERHEINSRKLVEIVRGLLAERPRHHKKIFWIASELLRQNPRTAEGHFWYLSNHQTYGWPFEHGLLFSAAVAALKKKLDLSQLLMMANGRIFGRHQNEFFRNARRLIEREESLAKLYDLQGLPWPPEGSLMVRSKVDSKKSFALDYPGLHRRKKPEKE